jgi:CheY-like chemotaxis protein
VPVPKPCRVLVVDDHPDSAETLAMVLNAMGHEASYVTSPASAEDAIKGFAPHLVLMDIGMPLVDGWTLARRIRTHPWGQELKLVAVTAYASPQDHIKSREAGFDAHLAKPMDPRMLHVLLEQCFEEPRR